MHTESPEPEASAIAVIARLHSLGFVILPGRWGPKLRYDPTEARENGAWTLYLEHRIQINSYFRKRRAKR